MDSTVHGVAKSQTQLGNLSFVSPYQYLQLASFHGDVHLPLWHWYCLEYRDLFGLLALLVPVSFDSHLEFVKSLCLEPARITQPNLHSSSLSCITPGMGSDT